MDDIRLTRINNIFLGVTDLSRSAAFYRETLGLELQFEMDGFVFLNAGGVANFRDPDGHLLSIFGPEHA